MLRNKTLQLIILTFFVVLISALAANSAIQRIAGLAVAESSTKWNHLKDAAVGDGLTSGILVSGNYMFNGTSWVGVRGDVTNGVKVQGTVNSYILNSTAIPVDASSTTLNANILNSTAIPVDASSTTLNANIVNSTDIPVDASSTPIILNSVGNQFYAIKNTVSTGGSANFPFGFTSAKVAVETPATNTDEVCVDWGGSTAACPASNTAGDDRLQAGKVLILDDFAVTSLSFIANSGTQEIFIRAWR